MPKTSLSKGYFGEDEDQNLVDEKPVEKPSFFKIWKSDSAKPEITKERSMEGIVRQNVNPKIEEILSKVLNLELISSHTFDAMASYFDSCDVAMPGLAKFLDKLSKSEKKHGNKLVDHMNGLGYTIVLDDITKPSVDSWDTPLSAMETCLDMVKSSNDFWLQLHKLVIKYGVDPCTEVLVKKFICEHVNLISVFGCHVVNLRRIEENPTGIYMYDQKSFGGELLIPDILDTDTDN